ncbi:MAG TPA: protein kinase [Vicinamibacteria bacterium]|nr:protein kinase [Vicinamibacteria bacterium]
MTLASGTRLGGYTFFELIGMGGMGEVYRARDEKLGREVAVKVLPEALRQDSERLQRFEREARVLASLNHPGIATLYGLESADGVTFLAMELVPGETLQERLARGNLAFDEVRDLFRQIAEALEAAHAAGIVHRDLKPANIKITPQGKIKILDFGLAKAFAAEEPDLDLSHSPTLTRGAGTQAGVILGTASYMSPEQAKARVVDERADIWALGCLLFESLAGRKAFDGESVTDILANVIHKDVPWDLLPAETSWRTRDVLRRCLAKDAAKRFHHVADARIELDLEDEPATIAADRRGVGSRALVAVGAGLGLFAGASLAALLLRTPEDTPPARGVERYVVYPPAADPPLEIESPAISRDGRLIAYVGIGEGERRVYLRTIDNVAPPFQTILVFPGSDGVQVRTSADLDVSGFFGFVLMSGRAVLYPVVTGTYERHDPRLEYTDANPSRTYAEFVGQWVKDVRRSLDYLESRPDIDSERIGFYGVSWGARIGNIVLAVEERFRVAVLMGGGLPHVEPLPEVAETNYAPRVKVPVLVLNGRYDAVFPFETNQKPMFELLGSKEKQHVVFESGHVLVGHRNQMVQRLLDWLDRHLGPVG